MKSSEILREAAKSLEESDGNVIPYSCVAIQIFLPGKPYVHSEEFRNSAPARAYAALLGRLPETGDMVDIDHRIVALCLAAAIAESEGD